MVCTDLRTLLCAASVIPVGGHPKHLLGTWERVSGIACALADRAACPVRLRYTFRSPHTGPTLARRQKSVHAGQMHLGAPLESASGTLTGHAALSFGSLWTRQNPCGYVFCRFGGP